MDQAKRVKKVRNSVIVSSIFILGLISIYNSCSDVAFDVYKDREIHKSQTSTVIINKNAQFTTSTKVNLFLDGLEEGEMYISNDPQCSVGYWEPYSTTRQWQINQENDRAKVYAKFKIEELEVFSPCVSDDIIHDNQTPTLDITSEQKKHTNKSSHNIIYQAYDALSGVKTLHCGVQLGKLDKTCNPNAGTIVNHKLEGSYNLLFQIEDIAGNISDLYTYQWVYDKTPPTLHHLQSSVAEVTSQKNALFKFAASDNLTFQEDLVYECIRLGDSTWNPCHSPVYFSEENLAGKSQHSFSVRVKDKAGNISLITSHTWTIKQGAIDIHITSAPKDYINTPLATFAFRAIEDGKTLSNDPNNFLCQLSLVDTSNSVISEGKEAPCSSLKSYSLINEGKYRFSVKAKNFEGNYSSPANRYFTYDKTIGKFLITGPAKQTKELTAIFNIVSVDNETDITKYECSLNNSTFSQEGCGPQAIYNELSIVKNSENTFRARLTDLAGNTSLTDIYKWTVDTKSPEIQWIQSSLPATETNSLQERINFTVSDNLTKESEIKSICRLEKDSVLIFEYGCLNTIELNNLIQGNYTVTAKAVDHLGNTSEPITHSWYVDSSQPELAYLKFPGQNEPIYNTQKGIVKFAGKNYADLKCQLGEVDYTEFCKNNVNFELPILPEGNAKLIVSLTNKFGNSIDFPVEWVVTAVGQCSGLNYDQCLVLEDDFERVDILDPSSAIGWFKVIDDKTRVQKVDVCIFPHEFCNFPENNIGNGQEIGPAGHGDKAAYFIGRTGGSVHSMYLVTKMFDLSEYNKINIQLKYLLTSLEGYIYREIEGQEHFKIEICNSTPLDCGITDNFNNLNNDTAWTTLHEHIASFASPINLFLNGSNHLQKDWVQLQLNDLDLNKLTVNKSQVTFRVNVKIDEGFYDPSAHSSIEVPAGTTKYQLIDGVGIDDIKIIAIK